MKPARVVERFEVLDEDVVAKEFELLPPDFDFGSLPREYVNSRDEARKTKNKPVIFIDGEGANDGFPALELRKQVLYRFVQKQNYALLGAVIEPDQYRCIESADHISQLPTRQCLDFILSLPETHIIIGFALTYDVEMWLRRIPPKYMERLVKTQAIWWKHYRIHYIPKKIFTVGLYKHGQKIRSRTIYDAYGFFQSDFKTAIRSWQVGTPEKWEFIDRMKDARGDFGPITEETKAYNREEGIEGIEMFRKVREEYTKLGLSIPKPVGAGSIASAMMRKHFVLDYFPHTQLIPIEVMLSAFIGGRFDCTRIGFMGDVIESDINSAYPHIARNLPCLRCGRYIQTEEFDDNPYSLWLVRWRDNGTRWSPFPYRTDNGSIRYYANGVGYYYGAEVQAALAFDDTIEVIGGYRYERNCDHRPFAFLEDYYQRREELKRVGDFGEIILKLGYNSVTGKLAQTRGKNPPFQQLIWAAQIYGGTRAMLLSAIRQNPDAIIKVATDAVFSTAPLQLDYDATRLGAWKTEELYDLLVLGNGVYQSTGSSNPKYPNGIARNRGFEKGDVSLRFNWPEIRENYRNGVSSIVKKYEFRRFVKASHENRMEERCDWIESEIRLSLDVQKAKRAEGELHYPLPNPTPNTISAPRRIPEENLRLPRDTH